MAHIAALLARLGAKWQEQRRVAADLAELRSCGPEEAARIAADMNIPAPELETLIVGSAGSQRLLDRMMAAFNLAREDVQPSAASATFRDIETTCARCSSRKRCARELAAGTAERNADLFCPNADVFRALSRA